MARGIRRVQSQELINVSQDYSSDPILKNTPPRAASSPAPPDGDTGAEDRVEESLTDNYMNGNKFPETHLSQAGEDLAGGREESLRNVEAADSKTEFSTLTGANSVQPTGNHRATPQRINHNTGDTQAVGAHLYSSATARIDRVAALPQAQTGTIDEEDLYEATPPRKSQTSLPRPHERDDEALVSPVKAALQSSANTHSHPIGTDSESDAMPPTGKLPAASSSLAALRERQQKVLGRSGEATTKIFENGNVGKGSSTKSAGKRAQRAEVPAKGPVKAVKAKDMMQGDVAGPKTTANRKRKAGSDPAVDDDDEANAPDQTSKRAKPHLRNKNVAPAQSKKPATHASEEAEEDDVYDLPGSPLKGGGSKTNKAVTSEAGAANSKAALKRGPAASKDVPATVKTGTRQVAHHQNPGEGRQLRSKKILPAKPDQSEDVESAAEDEVKGSNQTTRLKAVESLRQKTTQQARDNVRNSRQSNHLDNYQPVAKSTIKQEPPPVASRETAVIPPDNAQPSGSQHNAIVLSDLVDSSSSIGRFSPSPEELRGAKPEKAVTHRGSPAAIQSSPPRDVSRAGSQILRGTGRSRKTQIISFDKTGPLNQGTLPKSGSVRASVPPLTVPVNWGLSTGGANDLARKKPSSVATSVRSGRSNVAAPPSNVAPDVGDALAGLSKSKTQVPTGTFASASTTRVSEFATEVNKDDQQSYEVDDGGFATIDDVERFANSPSPGQQLKAELDHVPTASQTIMPPPKRKVQSPQRAAEAISTSRTTAQDPTRTRVTEAQRKISESRPQEIPNASAGLPSAVATRGSAATNKSDGKRPMLTEPSPERPVKRAKAKSPAKTVAVSRPDSTAEAKVTQPVKTRSSMAAAARTSQARPTVAFAESSTKRGEASTSATALDREVHGEETSTVRSMEPDKTAISKAVQGRKSTEESFPSSKAVLPGKAAQPRRRRHGNREPDRHFSQNSQTVDINGSPVPRDMQVRDLSTVLETFSQQPESPQDAGHLSRRFKTPMDVSNADEEDAYSVPPSYQPPPSMPSNTKAIPGPSGSSSKTMRHIKLTKVESDVFLDTNMRRPVSSDPFVSPRKDQGTACQPKQRDHLLERTVKFAQDIGQTAANDRNAASDSVRSPAKASSPLRTNKTKVIGSNVAPEAGLKFASDLDRQVAALRQHTAITRTVEEDPDMTLVNDCSQDTEVSKDVISSCSSSPESSMNGTPELVDEPESDSQSSDDDQDDLRMWRRGLKPHQLGLYEELVKIARVVTGYVTGQETSAEVMIDENYRRELMMVEQEEEVRKKQYKQSMVNLQQKKNEKIRELLSLDKVLQGVLDASDVSWEEHCRARAEKERANQKVAGLIASWL